MPRRPPSDAFKRSAPAPGPGEDGAKKRPAAPNTGKMRLQGPQTADTTQVAGGGGSPREQLNRLGFQIQVLASKLELLRDRAELLPEYAKLQALLAETQAKYREAELAVKGRPSA